MSARAFGTDVPDPVPGCVTCGELHDALASPTGLRPVAACEYRAGARNAIRDHYREAHGEQ